MPEPINLFFSYSHKDEALRDDLAAHLALLRRQALLLDWHDRRIGAGANWRGTIDEHINQAHIVLLLVSADFLASDYCYDVEMKQALQRAERGETLVIPVILRACDWTGSPFGHLRALPRDARPVTSWANRDEAWNDVVAGMRANLKQRAPERPPVAALIPEGKSSLAAPGSIVVKIELRLEQSIQSFDEEVLMRELSALLGSEVTRVHITGIRVGSVIVTLGGDEQELTRLLRALRKRSRAQKELSNRIGLLEISWVADGERRTEQLVRLSSREHSLVSELLLSLGSSLNLHLVLESTCRTLAELVPFDHGVLWIPKSAAPEDYEWISIGMPEAWLRDYSTTASHDFIRAIGAQYPNVVLRDEDMIDRPSLEANALYRRARELGVPFEHFISVLLGVEPSWHGGMTLYRERRHPFSQHDKQVLQLLSPAFANALRNCRAYGQLLEVSEVTTKLLDRDGNTAVIIMRTPTSEIVRTPSANAVIARWFAPEAGHGTLPQVLVETFQKAMASHGKGEDARPWMLEGPQGVLKVSFRPVPVVSARKLLWALLFEETRLVPPSWDRLLTPREREVLAGVLRGWDNRMISIELGCSEATVRKHLHSIFGKFGVDNRAMLIARAMHSG